MKYGISYTRVSTGRQAEEGTSLQAQESANVAKAEEMGVVIVEYFSDEGVSGELFEGRPGIQDLLKRLLKGDIGFVFINKLDRAGRNTTALHLIRERIQKAGAQCVFSGGQEFSNDSSGNFMHTVFAGAASFEKELIKERTVRGSRAKVTDKGQMVSPRSPYGYHIVTSADIIRGTYPEEMKGKYTLNTETQAVACWIYTAYDEGASLRSICLSLSEQGIPSPQGGNWSRGGLAFMLSNPVYKGQPAYGRRHNVTDESRFAAGKAAATYTVRVDPEHWLHLESPALVSEELWDRVQVRRRQNQMLFAGNPRNTYLLSGFLVCPGCGRQMRGITNKRRKAYYLCVKNSDHNRTECTWTTHLPAGDMDRRVLSFLTEYADDKDKVEQAIKCYLTSQTMVKPLLDTLRNNDSGDPRREEKTQSAMGKPEPFACREHRTLAVENRTIQSRNGCV
jgi:site-specific DNA recombinase